MTETERHGEITAIKSLLIDTDYQIIKAAETLLSCKSVTEIVKALTDIGEDIAATMAKRVQWRAKINELEAAEGQTSPDAEP